MSIWIFIEWTVTWKKLNFAYPAPCSKMEGVLKIDWDGTGSFVDDLAFLLYWSCGTLNGVDVACNTYWMIIYSLSMHINEHQITTKILDCTCLKKLGFNICCLISLGILLPISACGKLHVVTLKNQWTLIIVENII